MTFLHPIPRLLLALWLAVYVPACLCGAGSCCSKPTETRSCCQTKKSKDPAHKNCRCDDSRTATGLDHKPTLEKVTIDAAAMNPGIEPLRSAPLILDAGFRPLTTAANRPATTLLGQHCALIV